MIERDPEEKSDLRFALNYGHTIGHALEAATGYTRWTHGEAVSLGIVAEARLARRLGLAETATAARQERAAGGLGLPVRDGAVDVEAVLAAMTRDKKARDGRVPFVLAPRLGEFRVVYDVAPADIRAALDEARLIAELGRAPRRSRCDTLDSRLPSRWTVDNENSGSI